MKKGNKVRCIDDKDYGAVEVGNTYVVADTDSLGNILLEGVETGFYYRRTDFELVDELVEEGDNLPELYLEAGGVRITLDPNVPYSRKFAEAFLDVVYGTKLA